MTVAAGHFLRQLRLLREIRHAPRRCLRADRHHVGDHGLCGDGGIAAVGLRRPAHRQEKHLYARRLRTRADDAGLGRSWPMRRSQVSWLLAAVMATFNAGWGLIVLSLLSDAIAAARERARREPRRVLFGDLVDHREGGDRAGRHAGGRRAALGQRFRCPGGAAGHCASRQRRLPGSSSPMPPCPASPRLPPPR